MFVSLHPQRKTLAIRKFAVAVVFDADGNLELELGFFRKRSTKGDGVQPILGFTILRLDLGAWRLPSAAISTIFFASATEIGALKYNVIGSNGMQSLFSFTRSQFKRAVNVSRVS